MPLFKFTADNQLGEEIKGWIAAPDSEQAGNSLVKKGYGKVRVNPGRVLAAPASMPSKALAVFCRQMSSVWASDISFPEGILMIAEQSASRKLQSGLYNIYDKIINDKPLSEAMTEEGIFPEYIINMVAIGEVSGTLDEVFSQLAQYYEKEDRIKNKVRSAVTYPTLLAILLIWVIGLLVVKVLPMFEEMLISMGGQLPAITHFIIALSQFVTQYGIFILTGIAIIIFILLWIGDTRKGRNWFDKRKLGMPGFGFLYRRIVTSKFAHGMAIMLESGVQMDNAVGKVAKLLDNLYLENQFEKVKRDLEGGIPLAKAIASTGIFPSLMIRLLVVGERTGRLAVMLKKSASFFDEDVDDAIQRISTIIEPTMIVILSVIIGAILLAVMLPLINIMKVVG